MTTTDILCRTSQFVLGLNRVSKTYRQHKDFLFFGFVSTDSTRKEDG